MNLQSMMAQAQKMQRDIAKKQEEIANMEFLGTSEWVDLVLKGDNTLQSIKLKTSKIDAEDMEVFEDMIKIAFNDAHSKLEKETESKMGNYSKMNGLF